MLENQTELYRIAPEIAALHGRIQPPQWHPEGTVDVHIQLVVDRAVELGADAKVVWGAFIHDLGKGITPEAELPHHFAHEALGVPLVRTLGERLGVQENWIIFGQLCAKEHLNIHKFYDLRPVKKVDLIFRLGEYVADVALVAQADAQGRGPTLVDKPYPQRQAVIDAWNIIREITHENPENQRRLRAKAIAGKFGK